MIALPSVDFDFREFKILFGSSCNGLPGWSALPTEVRDATMRKVENHLNEVGEPSLQATGGAHGNRNSLGSSLNL